MPVAILMLLAACDVANEPEKEQVTVTYDRERIRQSADDARRTAGEVAKGVANVAGSTREAIEREVGDVDVDVRVTRERRDRAPAE